MGIFAKLFGKSKQPALPMKDTKDEAKELAGLIGCEWESVADHLTAEQIMQLYIAESEKGRNAGYTPVLLMSGGHLLEMVACNYEDNGGAEKFRNSLKSADTSQGEKILKERLNDNMENYEEFNGEDIDIYGEFADSIRPTTHFLETDKRSRDQDETLLLVRIPTDKPWEVFAWIPFGNWNECPDTADMMAVCRYWFEKYGAVPAFISSDILQLYVPQPITERSTALRIAEQQYGFCNDVVEQGMGTIKALASSLIGSSVWFFWWD